MHPAKKVYRCGKDRTVARIPPGLLAQMKGAVEGDLPWPLTIMGSVGVGKTCAVLALLDHTVGGIYETFGGLCELARQASMGAKEWYKEGVGGVVTSDQLWKGYRSAPVVAIDEVGARERVTQFQYDCLYDMLEIREGRPLILVTNSSLDELARVFDERVTSRIIAGTVVVVRGADLRDPRVQK